MTPQSRDGNFADLLAGLALGTKMPPQRDLDGLEDDVATLSYEEALRSRTRSLQRPSTNETSDRKPISTVREMPEVGSRQHTRRSSSVTVRFSASEAEQLHRRAAEAGITVSAYLRSCAFEVESLRAEVKSTLAQLRSVAPTPAQMPETNHGEPKRRWLRSWLRMFRFRSILTR